MRDLSSDTLPIATQDYLAETYWQRCPVDSKRPGRDLLDLQSTRTLDALAFDESFWQPTNRKMRRSQAAQDRRAQRRQAKVKRPGC